MNELATDTVVSSYANLWKPLMATDCRKVYILHLLTTMLSSFHGTGIQNCALEWRLGLCLMLLSK